MGVDVSECPVVGPLGGLHFHCCLFLLPTLRLQNTSIHTNFYRTTSYALRQGRKVAEGSCGRHRPAAAAAACELETCMPGARRQLQDASHLEYRGVILQMLHGVHTLRAVCGH